MKTPKNFEQGMSQLEQLLDKLADPGTTLVQSIALYSRCGSLESGKWANVVLLNKDLSIRNVIFKGEVIA